MSEFRFDIWADQSLTFAKNVKVSGKYVTLNGYFDTDAIKKTKVKRVYKDEGYMDEDIFE